MIILLEKEKNLRDVSEELINTIIQLDQMQKWGRNKKPEITLHIKKSS